MYFIYFSNYKYVKGHQNNPQTPRILPRRDHAPGFDIPGSASDESCTPPHLLNMCKK